MPKIYLPWILMAFLSICFLMFRVLGVYNFVSHRPPWLAKERVKICFWWILCLFRRLSEYKLVITFQVSFKAVLLWGMIVITQGMKVFEKVVIQNIYIGIKDKFKLNNLLTRTGLSLLGFWLKSQKNEKFHVGMIGLDIFM